MLQPACQAVLRGAHPRRCGADPVGSATAARTSGSSPQVRGRSAGENGRSVPWGLIPAGAGQMIWAINFLGCPVGSSPQVRGRCKYFAGAMHFSGLIPAGAGQIPDPTRPDPSLSAHPRRCGADRTRMFCRIRMMGSSPQVRGRCGGHLHEAGQKRLIPAGAGQICASPTGAHAPSAHPRRCGADLGNPRRGRRGQGSSPQVRGR